MTLFTVGVLLFTAWASPASAGTPAKDPALYPDISDTGSVFKINVRRSYASPFELGLIVKSEEAAATRKFYERMRARDAKKKKRNARPAVDRIAFPAIVRDQTPGELMATVRAFRTGDFTAADSRTVSAASLDYRASVRNQAVYTSPRTPAKTFRNVFAVSSLLEWHHFCGAGCGLHFTGKKTVIFSSGGEILDIVTEGVSMPEGTDK